MEKSRQFYEEAIGWTCLGLRPNGRCLDMTDGVNNITLLQQAEDMVRPELEDGSEYIHFGVIVDDLEAVRERLESWGATILREHVKDLVDPNVPQVSFKVIDPDGNIVDVSCNKEEWRGIQI